MCTVIHLAHNYNVLLVLHSCCFLFILKFNMNIDEVSFILDFSFHAA